MIRRKAASWVVWVLMGCGLCIGLAQELATHPPTSCAGAIVMDAASGAALHEDRADAEAPPASLVKLMTLLIVLDHIKAGALRPHDAVPVTAEATALKNPASKLKEGEALPVDKLLRAMITSSADDAAAALAIRVAGSLPAFTHMMNVEAQNLGLKSSRFRSVHGQSPDPQRRPEVTTARDLARLCCILIRRHPDVFRYLSGREPGFSRRAFVLCAHNPLQDADSGFSIAATEERRGQRLVAVVLGCSSRKLRNARAAELLKTGFRTLPGGSP